MGKNRFTDKFEFIEMNGGTLSWNRTEKKYIRIR